MFKFSFNLQDAELCPDIPSEAPTASHDSHETSESQVPPFTELTASELAKSLPLLMSYTPLRIPSTSGKDYGITIPRRDLFDARFQLFSEEGGVKDLEFIDNPSDLVPGVYEGGLKTWECSVDLAAYLEENFEFNPHDSYNIIEIGCGTAIPSLALLQKLWKESSNDITNLNRDVTLNFQDYNLSVLQLITLPNIILNWYASPAAVSYRTAQSSPNLTEPGEIEITPELISTFLHSLQEYHIQLKFFGGAWHDLESLIRHDHLQYDLAVSSETIYNPSSLPSLVTLLREACAPKGPESSSVDVPPHFTSSNTRESRAGQCLIAAKVIYFGVGGGTDEFQDAVKGAGGKVQRVFEKKDGVGRQIMSLDWSHY